MNLQVTVDTADACANMESMMRGRAVAARRAHNPEAVGSNPTPAIDVKVSPFGDVAQLVRARDS